MYSGTKKPTRVSGKNPAFMRGDYLTSRMKKSQQDLINEGKKFKFSALKKPYMSNADYQTMEYEATPLIQSPFSPSAMFPPFAGWDGVPLTFDPEEMKPHPCTCGGSCTGSPEKIKDLWKKIRKEINIGKLEPTADAIEDYINKSSVKPVFVGLFDSYQCSGTGIEQAGKFLICGGKEEFGHITSSVSGDSLSIELVAIIPFANEERCTSIQRCACWYLIVDVDCGKGFMNCTEPRDIFISTCDGTKAMKIYPKLPPIECSDLAIVDEDGTPATDTILRNGSLDFKTTGDCCEALDWTVTVDAGSTLGGSTITGAGVLTVGATSCGSLKVTASCAVCGTSATQYVRVTDAGVWGNEYTCHDTQPGGICCGNAGQSQTIILGKYKETAIWQRYCHNNLTDPCTFQSNPSCSTFVPQNYTAACGTNKCALYPYETGVFLASLVRYEWKC